MKKLLITILIVVGLFSCLWLFDSNTYVEDRECKYVIPKPWELIYEDGKFSMELNLKK